MTRSTIWRAASPEEVVVVSIDEPEKAALAFGRAFERYFARGFLPRAIAMAKLVKSIDGARGDLLERSLPAGAPLSVVLPPSRRPITPGRAAIRCR